ncbi:MAG: acetylxylan esterase [Acidobacteria bacterium]|nr:acetylxylan esterase [Acidobacteriota bacterium]
MRKYLYPCVLLVSGVLTASSQTPVQNEQFKALQAHFDRVIAARYNTLFDGIESVAQWEQRKQKTRDALRKMLWHNRRLPFGPPPAKLVHREERGEYTLEVLTLETAPGLYLTTNLYLPRRGQKPFPVILYQCGHANKSEYAHHGAWFAAHGIAALVMDNIEQGEIQTTHHGVYSHAWFHWYSRGYSPLAAEMLNAVRAVDYLTSRPDLDSKRIGATGRSGGGMATFFLAALDERVSASAPVSGTFSTSGWIKQRLAFAHCDCQYPVNSYGLMYSEIGALTAPRKQLLVNADADRGFPMDAFNEMAEKMREIYRLYNAGGDLRTAVTHGGHADTEEIRLPVFSFFLKEFLGIETAVATEGPIDKPPRESLVCFRDGAPLDERLTRIDEELIPAYTPNVRAMARSPKERIDAITGALRTEVFRYFPEKAHALAPVWGEEKKLNGRTSKRVSFNSFEDLRVQGVFSRPITTTSRSKLPAALVIDHRRGMPRWGNEQPLEMDKWGERAVLVIETLDRGTRALEQNLRSFNDDDLLHHMKRQAMVAGTTIESMQLYEVLRSLEFLKSLPDVDPLRITIVGKGETGVHGLYAALLDSSVRRVVLGSPPASHRQGPTYLGILRYTDIPEVIGLLRNRVRLYGEIPSSLKPITAKRGLDKPLVAESLADSLR